VLLFITDVNTYRQSFESRIVEGSSPEDVVETYKIWREILGTYIMPNGHKEINIPGAVRNKLLSYQDPLNPPSPTVLQPACDMMMELMTTTYYQFVENIRASRSSVLSEKPSCVHACSDDEGTDSNDPIPFYRRAHALWGPSRVYRNVRYYNGNTSISKTSVPNTSSSSLDKPESIPDNRSKSRPPLRRTALKWTSSSSSPS